MAAVIDEKQAIEIATKDASLVYRDLTIYETSALLIEDNWLVDFEIKDPNLQGGGPHYVISGTTGEILRKRYEQ
ncbi:MAG: hypothetical protein ACJ8DI_13875 [Ktedonobacteraceae bacterium]